MQEIGMPDINKGATLQHVYNWIYNGGSFGKSPSVEDLIEKGYLPLIQGRLIYWDTSNADLRATASFQDYWLNYTSTFQSYTKEWLQNIQGNSRLINVIGSTNPYNMSTPALKCVLINQLLGAGGTLAATELIPLVAGKKIFPEEIKVELNPATANISAVGGNAAEITFDNSGGTILAVGVVSHTKQETYIKLNGSPVAGENLRMTVAAGIGGHVGASRLRGYILYREV